MYTRYVYGFVRGQVLCAASVTHRSTWSERSHQQHVRQATCTVRPVPPRGQPKTKKERKSGKEGMKCELEKHLLPISRIDLLTFFPVRYIRSSSILSTGFLFSILTFFLII